MVYRITIGLGRNGLDTASWQDLIATSSRGCAARDLARLIVAADHADGPIAVRVRQNRVGRESPTPHSALGRPVRRIRQGSRLDRRDGGELPDCRDTWPATWRAAPRSLYRVPPVLWTRYASGGDSGLSCSRC